jgi:hypothetical protein
MTRHRTAFWTGVIAVTVLFTVFARPVRAYEEQASVDGAAGAGLLPGSTLPAFAPSADLGAAMGLSDMFVLRGAVGYAGLVEAERRTRHAGRARAELAYLIDVLRWVPYFGAGGSLWALDDGGLAVRASAHVLFGLDFLYDRSWTFGIDLRTGIFWEPLGVSSMSEAQLRLSRMFDLF